MNIDDLVQDARKIRERAYAPYSQFAVGAALRTASGRVFCGCNVENISFGLTICAERAAVLAAVTAGETDFVALAIVADSVHPVSPCGACRQVLAEFSATLSIRCSNLSGDHYDANLSELLPRAKEGILGT
jgi:cytidine deaminase